MRSTDGAYWTGSAWQATAVSLTATNPATTGNTIATWTSSASLPTWAAQPDATYTIHANATDKAGNSFTGSAVSFTLDDTRPAIASVTTPSGGNFFQASAVPAAFGGSVADNTGGVGLNADSTTFTLQRSTDGAYWTGSGWQASAVALSATNSATSAGTAATWTSSASLPVWAAQSDAVYTLQATATDRDGNTFSGTAVSFTLDDTGPVTASVTTPAGGSSFRAATVPAAFSGIVADNSGGVGLYANSTTFTLQRSSDSEYWTGSGWQATAVALTATNSATSAGTAATWTSSASLPAWAAQPDAVYTIQATATDRAGNTFAGTAVSFTLDDSVPVSASVTTPSSGSSFRAATVPASFSGSVADNSGGVGVYADSTTFTLQRSTDGAYWTGSAWQATAVSLTATNPATTSNTIATWTSSASLPTWATQPDATYTIQATATDKAGNSFTGSAVSFTLDDTRPAIASVTTPSGGNFFQASAVPAAFVGSAADNTGGVGLNADSTTFTLQRSTDGAYWTGSGWQATAVALSATNSATSAGTAATWTSSAGLPVWAAQSDAVYTLQATATDRDGNTFSGTAVSFTLDDTGPVTASVTTPSSGSSFRAATVPAAFSGIVADNTSGVGLYANSTTFTLQRSSDCDYWTGSGWQATAVALTATNSATSAATAATWTTSVLLPIWSAQPDATYTLQATATDKAGNAFTGSAATFTLDDTTPTTAAVTTPSGGNFFQASAVPATFSGTAADNAGGVGLNVNSTSFTWWQRSTDGHYWNGSIWQVAAFNLATTNSPTTGSTATIWMSSATLPAWAAQPDAVYTVQATATDKDGNTFSGTAVSFTLDDTAPTIATVTTPSNGSIFQAATVPAAFGGSAADNAGGVGLYANSTTFTLQRSTDSDYWTGSGWQATAVALTATNSATTGNTAATWISSASLPTWAAQPDAVYTIHATTTDKAGNTFTGTALSFTLDDTGPAIASVTTPAGGSSFRATTAPAAFSGSVADNVGGVGLNANTTTFTLQRSTDGEYWTGSGWQATAVALTATNSATTGGTAATWTNSATLPTWSAQPDAVYTVQATATDKAGDTLSGTAASFTLDDTAPTTASVTTPVGGGNYQAPTVPATFGGSVADNSGGVGLFANSTTFTLQRSTDGDYWNGSIWQVAVFNLAATNSATTGSTGTAWTSSAALPTWASQTDGVYMVQARATDAVGNAFSGSPVSFTLNSVAASLVVATPANVAAGSPFSVTVTAKDQNGHVATSYLGTIHFASSDTLAVLPANYTFTATDAGVHTFTVTLKIAGTKTLTVTDTLHALTATNSIIVSGAATHYVITGIPATDTAGAPLSFTVTALDALNNTAVGYTGTVHFTSTDPAASLPVNAVLTSGVGSFAATLKTAGAGKTITATDTVNPAIKATATATVVAAATYKFTLTTPATAAGNTAFSITVKAQDLYGNPTTPVVHFSSSDGAATLPSNTTLAATGSTFSTVKILALGAQTITVTDISANNISAAATNSIAVYGAATQIVVQTTTTSVAAGTAVTYKVTVQDSNGDTALGYRGTVHFASTDSKAVLPANYTFTAADSGVHTFTTVTYKTAGTPTLTLTDTANLSIMGQNSSVTVNAAAASKFVLTPILPTSISAGNSVSFTVTAEDAYGNTAMNFAGTVAFTSTDAHAQLPLSTPLTNGVGTFSAVLETAGSRSITVSASGVASASGVFTVTAAAAAYFVVSVPATATVGTAFTVTVTAKDQYGNTVTNYGTTLTPSSSAAAILPASVTMTNGTAAFAATLETTGTETISVLDTSSLSGTSAGITVGGKVATRLN